MLASLSVNNSQHGVPRKDRVLSRVNNNRYQIITATSAEISCEHVEVPLSESRKKVDPEIVSQQYSNVTQNGPVL